MTLYQADWSLATISLQLGRSPVLELPLQSFPQLGEQIWGLVLPTRPDGSDPVLLSLTSEQGPVQVFGPDGVALAQLVPGGEATGGQGAADPGDERAAGQRHPAQARSGGAPGLRRFRQSPWWGVA